MRLVVRLNATKKLMLLLVKLTEGLRGIMGFLQEILTSCMYMMGLSHNSKQKKYLKRLSIHQT